LAASDYSGRIPPDQEKEEALMKNVIETFERVFMAVAFAELGEFDTAREIIAEKPGKRRDQKRDSQKSGKVSDICTGI
jgi:hypothetical protein